MPSNHTATTKVAIGPARTKSGWIRTPSAITETPRMQAVQDAASLCAQLVSGSGIESFGARLRRLRRTRRLSQAQLAAALDVSAPSVSGWEKDRTRPRFDRVEALGQLLGVSADELLGDEVSRSSPDILAESRAQIAHVVGTTPDKVWILIEF